MKYLDLKGGYEKQVGGGTEYIIFTSNDNYNKIVKNNKIIINNYHFYKKETMNTIDNTYVYKIGDNNIYDSKGYFMRHFCKPSVIIPNIQITSEYDIYIALLKLCIINKNVTDAFLAELKAGTTYDPILYKTFTLTTTSNITQNTTTSNITQNTTTSNITQNTTTSNITYDTIINDIVKDIPLKQNEQLDQNSTINKIKEIKETNTPIKDIIQNHTGQNSKNR
jgi:hypothetical protein